MGFPHLCERHISLHSHYLSGCNLLDLSHWTNSHQEGCSTVLTLPGWNLFLNILRSCFCLKCCRKVSTGEHFICVDVEHYYLWWKWRSKIVFFRKIAGSKLFHGPPPESIPHICHFFTRTHLSHENFTLGKCVSLRQNCPATKQRSLSVKLHTKCKITHLV